MPFTAAAVGQLGKKVVANIVAVGALAQAIGWLASEAVEDAVKRRVPAKFRELERARRCSSGRRLGAEALRGGGSARLR